MTFYTHWRQPRRWRRDPGEAPRRRGLDMANHDPVAFEAAKRDARCAFSTDPQPATSRSNSTASPDTHCHVPSTLAALQGATTPDT
jgi:hypothetical protein